MGAASGITASGTTASGGEEFGMTASDGGASTGMDASSPHEHSSNDTTMKLDFFTGKAPCLPCECIRINVFAASSYTGIPGGIRAPWAAAAQGSPQQRKPTSG
jgi:hypothetical protein